MTVRRRIAAALAVVGLVGLLAPLGQHTAQAASGSTLTIGIAEHGATLNPFLANLDPDLDAIAAIYPSLDRYDEDSNFVPYLADSWTTSADKLTWTFSLHPGLRWTDGTPITATDVAWTFNLIMTNATAGTANAQLLTNFASVTARGDSTVVITTKKPQANLLYVVYIPIVPKHVWESRVATLGQVKNTDKPVVGYGPWQLTDYATDQYITLRANKSFFLGAPKYDTLVLQTFKNIDAAVNGLRSGQVDQVDKLTSTEYRALAGRKDVFAYQQVGSRWTGIELNPGARSKSGRKLGTGNPALADATVRTAIAYGIDRATLVKKVLNGLGQVGAGYLPPAFPDTFWTPPAGQTVRYSPAKANAMLDAAGYRRGRDGVRTDPTTGKKLSFRLGTHSEDTDDTEIAGYLVSWMRNIGITLTIESQSNSALNANLAKGDWDILMDGWGTTPDSTYLLGIQTCGVLPDDKAVGGQTDAFFCDPRYDALQDAQQQQFDRAKRSQYIRDMQKILYAANVDIILFYQNELAAVSADKKAGFVQGTPNEQGFYPFQNFKLGWQEAVPPQAGTDTGSSAGVAIGILVVVVVSAGLVLVSTLRRRAHAYDRE